MRGVSNTMVNALSVNVNGVGATLKRRWVGTLRKKHYCQFFCIQETRTKALNPTWVKELWGNGTGALEEVEASGRSGGLCTIWNRPFSTPPR